MFTRMMLAAFVVLALAQLASAGDTILTGEITYRERVALPQGAQLRVSLVALPGGTTVASASAPIASQGQVPLLFTLKVRSTAIANGGNFGLVATIRAQGRTLFGNRDPVPVNVLAPAPAAILVSVSPAGAVPAPEPAIAGSDTPSALLDSAWTVTGIGGKPTLSAARISLSIAPDRRAGGHSGCNSYFTEASFENAPVRFGPIAATRMACGPEVMAQETALFAALAATTGFKASGRTLQLLDAAGVPLISLVRSP